MTLTEEQMDAARQDAIISLLAEVRVAMILHGIKVKIERGNRAKGTKVFYLFDGDKVAADYDIKTGTLTWREGGTTKIQDALIKVHASTYTEGGGLTLNSRNKESEDGMFVIVREDGKFVSTSGSEHSYTDNLMNAKTFATSEDASKELCIENERIAPVRDLLKKPN